MFSIYYFRWSYGILLYEIVTLGGTPYPKDKIEELLGKLKRGYRMEKPHNCSQDLYVFLCIKMHHVQINMFFFLFFSYNVMLHCWNSEPNKRPTFTELRQEIDWFISHYESQNVFPNDFFRARAKEG